MTDVDVFTAVALAAGELIEQLDTDERTYAAALRGERHKDRYVTAHAMHRRSLAERTATPAAGLRFARRPSPRCGQPHGKPYLPAHPSTAFSLSHSGDIAVVAVSNGCEVGVDVEDLSRKRDIPALAAKTLSGAELAWFEAAGASPE